MRDSYFDNIKLFLVALVVIGHLGLGPTLGRSISFNAAYIFIYLFHIPLFVFVSGFFSKNINKESYSQKILSNLIVPYVIFQIMYKVFDFFIYDRQEFSLSLFNPFYALWFLVSLAIWKLLLPYIVKVKFCLAISFIGAILIGYISDAGNYLSLSRTIVFLPFFLLGYFTERRHLDFLSKKPLRILSLLLLLLTLIVIYFYGQGINRVFLLGSSPYSSTETSGLYRLILFVVSILLSMAVLSLVPRRKIPLISSMGTRTMYPFILHAFLVFYLYSVGFYNHINSPLDKVLWIMFCVAFTLFLSTKFVQNIFKWLVEPNLKWLFKNETEEKSPQKSYRTTEFRS